MNLQQLITFLWVARLGGVRKAAMQMHLSQPAISARIAALEDHLGTTLFKRHPKGVTPTARGQVLHRYAEQIAAILEDINANVANPAELESTLRIGVSETIVQSWLPQFTTRLNHQFPQITLELSVDISVNLREALLDRSLDLVILLGPISHYAANNLDLPEIELAWFRSASIDFDESTDPAELFTRYPIVTYAKNTRPYNELKIEIGKRYGHNTRLFPSTSLTACFRMVAEGLAIGALPRRHRADRPGAGKIQPFDPGWQPNALHFTASWLNDQPGFVTREAAQIAQNVAIDHEIIEPPVTSAK